MNAYRLHTSQYRLTVNDIDGNLIPIDTTNITKLKVGRDNNTPILELASNASTPNGSSITNINPLTVVLDQDDLTFQAGIYDVELIVLDDATGKIATHIDHGIFVLGKTQLGGVAIT
jgi:hypothetical protein